MDERKKKLWRLHEKISSLLDRPLKAVRRALLTSRLDRVTGWLYAEGEI